MPGHPGTSGDGWQLVTSGWNFMYVPNCKPPHKSLATAREQLYDKEYFTRPKESPLCK